MSGAWIALKGPYIRLDALSSRRSGMAVKRSRERKSILILKLTYSEKDLSPVAMTRFDNGWIGWNGDVNAEEGSTHAPLVILARMMMPPCCGNAAIPIMSSHLSRTVRPPEGLVSRCWKPSFMKRNGCKE